jgi:AGCS family alanine or glycine:cation symporter
MISRNTAPMSIIPFFCRNPNCTMRIILLSLIFCFPMVTLAQIDLQISKQNLSADIKDATAVVEVSGGVAPYTFKWSKKDISLQSSTCAGMDEGIPYNLLVTDSQGTTAFAEFETEATSIEEKLNSFFIPIVDALAAVLLWDPFAAIGIYDPVVYVENGQPLLHPNGDAVTQDCWLVVVLLIVAAAWFTVYFGFINVRGFKHAVHITMGKYAKPQDKGEVSQFQALTAALSGTLGLGNISLVAVAIAVGGPGATFWMIVAGLIGMSSKFIECTLGVKYRNIDENGEVSGGPMYYLSKGLAKRKMKGLGKVLAVLFAIMCVGGTLGGGNMIQANQAFAQVSQTLGAENVSSLWFGVVMAILVGLVIVGGIKSIARVTDKIVPGMVAVYCIFALIIIVANISNLGSAFAQIWNGAFHPDAMKGGFMGVMLMGFRRASFSNEAGIGSASIAHSASKTDRPVSEGLVSLLEPFIDTVIVCTMTALVLVFTGYAQNTQGLTGSSLTNAAFTSMFPWFDWVLMIAIIMFAYATMISWSYYGMKSWAYLFGEKRWIKQTFNLLFMVCTVIGSVSGLGAVIDFSDMMILGMAFPNIVGLFIMSKEVKIDLKSYLKDLKDGAIVRYK